MTDIRKDYPEYTGEDRRRGERRGKCWLSGPPTMRELQNALIEINDKLTICRNRVEETRGWVKDLLKQHDDVTISHGDRLDALERKEDTPDPIDVENTMGWLNLSDGEWDHMMGDTQDKLIAAYRKAKRG